MCLHGEANVDSLWCVKSWTWNTFIGIRYSNAPAAVSRITFNGLSCVKHVHIHDIYTKAKI